MLQAQQGGGGTLLVCMVLVSLLLSTLAPNITHEVIFVAMYSK